MALIATINAQLAPKGLPVSTSGIGDVEQVAGGVSNLLTHVVPAVLGNGKK